MLIFLQWHVKKLRRMKIFKKLENKTAQHNCKRLRDILTSSFAFKRTKLNCFMKEEIRIAKCRLAEYELREKSMHKNFMALHSKFMDRIYQMDDEVISYVIELARNNGTIECMTYYFNSIIDRRNQVIEVLIKDLKQLLLPSYYKYLISIAENFSRFDEFSNQFPRRDMRDEFVKVTEKVKEDCY